jgi:cyclic pyranopterin phosphate synthase
MVDVTPKEATHRRAMARCKVFMRMETTSKVASNAITKGDVLAAARIAGIQAAKRTADLIPLCHPLLVGAVTINFTIGDDHIEIESQVETVDRTGVEMEALTSCAVAALTIYDMCKSSDRSMVVGELALWEKTGGRSGHWRRPADSLADPLVNTPPNRSFDVDEAMDDLLGPADALGDGSLDALTGSDPGDDLEV